ncbi:TfoX/Sxy family protein [candidate division KSB1 bacterium]
MPFDELLSDRISNILKENQLVFEERKMMGGLCYMVNNKMCVGIVKDKLMARIDPEIYDEALHKKGCREIDFTRRPMKGFVFVEPEGIDMDEDLEYWIKLALEYNPKAKSTSKKKKKSSYD